MIADFFGVSLDYLTGRSDTVCINPEKQFVCDYLGLTEEAVDNILECGSSLMTRNNDRYKEFIDRFGVFYGNEFDAYAAEALNELFSQKLIYELIIIRASERVLKRMYEDMIHLYDRQDTFYRASVFKRDKFKMCLDVTDEMEQVKYSRYHSVQWAILKYLHETEEELDHSEVEFTKNYCRRISQKLEDEFPRKNFPKAGPFLGRLRILDFESIADWVTTVNASAERIDEELKKAGMCDKNERSAFIKKIFNLIKQRNTPKKEFDIYGDD